MKKLRAKHVSASESSGEYFQVLFEEKEDSDKAYLLIQRQFEMPSRLSEKESWDADYQDLADKRRFLR